MEAILQSDPENSQPVAASWANRTWFRDAFWLMLVVAACCKFCWGLEASMDVRGFDELGMYLQPGVTLPETGLLDGAYAPLYQLWYYGLSKVAPDSVDLYYLNYKVLLLLISICVYVLIRQCKFAAPIAFIGAFYVLNSHLPYVYPFCSHFATLLILLGAIGAMAFRRSAAKLAMMSIGLLLAAYARPEFFLAFLLTITFLIFQLLIQAYRKRVDLEDSTDEKLNHFVVPIPVIAMGVAAIALIGFFGSPWSNPNPDHQGHRGFFAFGQHYALNCVESTGETTNSWADWRAFVERDFGDAQSMKECLFANPQAFAWHVGRNFQNSFWTFGEIAKPNSTPIIVGLGLLMLLTLKRRAELKPMKGGRELFLLLSVIFLATMPAVVLIYPRDHYVLPLFTITLVLIVGRLAQGRTIEFASTDWRRFALPAMAVVAAILFTPQRAEQVPMELAWEKENHFIKTIRFLNDQEFQTTPRIVRTDTGLEWMVDFPMEPIVPFKHKVPFLQFILQHGADVIVDDYNLRDAIFKDDDEYNKFVADPRKFGFERRDIPDSPRQVYFRVDLLDSPQALMAKEQDETFQTFFR